MLPFIRRMLPTRATVAMPNFKIIDDEVTKIAVISSAEIAPFSTF